MNEWMDMIGIVCVIFNYTWNTFLSDDRWITWEATSSSDFQWALSTTSLPSVCISMGVTLYCHHHFRNGSDSDHQFWNGSYSSHDFWKWRSPPILKVVVTVSTTFERVMAVTLTFEGGSDSHHHFKMVMTVATTCLKLCDKLWFDEINLQVTAI